MQDTCGGAGGRGIRCAAAGSPARAAPANAERPGAGGEKRNGYRCGGSIPSGASTGPSGLFGVYTNKMVKIAITGNGRTVTRFIGGFDAEYSQVVLVKL